MLEYESSINLYQMIFKVCGIGAIIMLLVSVALFFLLKIPKVYGELSGKYAKRAIQQMEDVNAQTGKLVSSHKVSTRKKKREIPKSRPIVQSFKTRKIEIKTDQLSAPKSVQTYSAETEILQETMPLNMNQQPMNSDVHYDDTSKAYDNNGNDNRDKNNNGNNNRDELNDAGIKQFVVERSIMLIHTQENI